MSISNFTSEFKEKIKKIITNSNSSDRNKYLKKLLESLKNKKTLVQAILEITETNDEFTHSKSCDSLLLCYIQFIDKRFIFSKEEIKDLLKKAGILGSLYDVSSKTFETINVRDFIEQYHGNNDFGDWLETSAYIDLDTFEEYDVYSRDEYKYYEKYCEYYVVKQESIELYYNTNPYEESFYDDVIYI
jgi:hypothetical protein